MLASEIGTPVSVVTLSGGGAYGVSGAMLSSIIRSSRTFGCVAAGPATTSASATVRPAARSLRREVIRATLRRMKSPWQCAILAHGQPVDRGRAGGGRHPGQWVLRRLGDRAGVRPEQPARAAP